MQEFDPDTSDSLVEKLNEIIKVANSENMRRPLIRNIFRRSHSEPQTPRQSSLHADEAEENVNKENNPKTSDPVQQILQKNKERRGFFDISNNSNNLTVQEKSYEFRVVPISSTETAAEPENQENQSLHFTPTIASTPMPPKKATDKNIDSEDINSENPVTSANPGHQVDEDQVVFATPKAKNLVQPTISFPQISRGPLKRKVEAPRPSTPLKKAQYQSQSKVRRTEPQLNVIASNSEESEVTIDDIPHEVVEASVEIEKSKTIIPKMKKQTKIKFPAKKKISKPTGKTSKAMVEKNQTETVQKPVESCAIVEVIPTDLSSKSSEVNTSQNEAESVQKPVESCAIVEVIPTDLSSKSSEANTSQNESESDDSETPSVIELATTVSSEKEIDNQEDPEEEDDARTSERQIPAIHTETTIKRAKKRPASVSVVVEKTKTTATKSKRFKRIIEVVDSSVTDKEASEVSWPDAQQQVVVDKQELRYNMRERVPYSVNSFIFNENVAKNYTVEFVVPNYKDKSGVKLRKLLRENSIAPSSFKVEPDSDFIDQLIPDSVKLKIAKDIVKERKNMAKKPGTSKALSNKKTARDPTQNEDDDVSCEVEGDALVHNTNKTPTKIYNLRPGQTLKVETKERCQLVVFTGVLNLKIGETTKEIQIAQQKILEKGSKVEATNDTQSDIVFAIFRI